MWKFLRDTIFGFFGGIGAHILRVKKDVWIGIAFMATVIIIICITGLFIYELVQNNKSPKESKGKLYFKYISTLLSPVVAFISLVAGVEVGANVNDSNPGTSQQSKNSSIEIIYSSNKNYLYNNEIFK